MGVLKPSHQGRCSDLRHVHDSSAIQKPRLISRARSLDTSRLPTHAIDLSCDISLTASHTPHYCTLKVRTMSGNSSKPAIPAWQRAQQQQPLNPSTDASTAQDADVTDNTTPDQEESATRVEAQEPSPESSNTDDAPLSAEERAQQLEIVRAFLEDPGVKDEPIERKREFLEAKGISQDMIEEELGTSTPVSTATPSSTSISAADFASFKQTTQPQSTPPAPRVVAPPIITYPEFLEDARKPPPLITPTRILNATYIASAIAAVAYGASTFLVKPMAASLTDARHDFASHGQSKIDEFNERLSKLVSKIPEPKSTTDEAESEDAESIASDPTELFHRDIGTQTSPAISPPPSTANAQAGTPTVADKQNGRLDIIKSHLDEMLAGVQAGEQPAKDRLEETNKLRHHLDNMMYRVQTANMWNGGYGGGFATDAKAGTEALDAIEEVKKEIRGVKGVLLSAKRFAPVGTVPGRVVS
jgi:hypothetical protein